MWNLKGRGRPQEARMTPGSERLCGLLMGICAGSSMAAAVDREEGCAAA